jgi:predicted nucleic acid-binding protein
MGHRGWASVTERCVFDASTAFAWVHPAQATEGTDDLLLRLKRGLVLVVPVIWFQETANALLVLERRKRLKAGDRREALRMLSGLNAKPDYDGIPLIFTKVSELAEVHCLSVYDATYLELALREQLPLASLDPPLQRSARKCGVTVLLP